MTQEELNEKLKLHREWMTGPDRKTKVSFKDADLRGLDLSNQELKFLLFVGANLDGANLDGANMASCGFYGASMRGVSAKGTVFASAGLGNVNLDGTDLSTADLRGAIMEGANISNAILPPSKIPETDTIIGYKKVEGDIVLELVITGERNDSVIGNKCRCKRAFVTRAYYPQTLQEKVQGLKGKEVFDKEFFRSIHNPAFVYWLEKWAEEPLYKPIRTQECLPGIHFFRTYKEAADYTYAAYWAPLPVTVFDYPKICTQLTST